ncbi:MAG: ABC transporter ATP-binding protein [Gemmatimonadales bacterium]
MSTTPLLAVRGLTRRFHPAGPAVVSDASFEVHPGEIFVLLGPSGCGKTTTLRLIAGFEPADQGSIALDGTLLTDANAERPVHVAPDKRGVGFVFQDYALFPHLNVVKNVMYGLPGWRGARKARAMEALKMVGMEELAERRPHALSGGQQQRVAIARSLAPAPRLLLLDEPFSNLDAALRESTREEVRRLLHQQGMAAILVTHDQEEALSFGDRLAVMNQGRIEQVGTPEEVYRLPSSLFAARFLGQTNVLRVAARDGCLADSPLGCLKLHRNAEGNVLVSIRPEHVSLLPPGASTTPAGTIVGREYRGHDLVLKVQVGEDQFTALTDFRCQYCPGDLVSLSVSEPAVVIER